MDIYYNQFSIEEVVQQPTFAFLSLLDEIGGFLGLILGASVLTVSELIDFLLVNSLIICKGRKKQSDTEDKDEEERNYLPSQE